MERNDEKEFLQSFKTYFLILSFYYIPPDTTSILQVGITEFHKPPENMKLNACKEK